ncbi:MAG: Holliday junction branch migration protein RuvA [Anaerorhabdus sp.]
MIAFLRGKVCLMGTDWIVLDVQGVGYKVFFSDLGKVVMNEEVQVFTYQHVREDELALYGFLSAQDQSLFLKFISVKGVGPKTAMGFFGRFSVDQLIQAIETSDIAFLKVLPGIGSKTASQIILDLKGKLVSGSEDKSLNSEMEDALTGLKSLGYKAGELKPLANYFREHPNLTSDDYLKMGLQYLMKAKRGE